MFKRGGKVISRHVSKAFLQVAGVLLHFQHGADVSGTNWSHVKQISVKMARAAIKVVSDLPDRYLGFYFGIKALWQIERLKISVVQEAVDV